MHRKLDLVKRRRGFVNRKSERSGLAWLPLPFLTVSSLVLSLFACSGIPLNQSQAGYDAALQKMSETEAELMGTIGSQWIPRSEPNLVTCAGYDNMKQIWSKHTGETVLKPVEEIQAAKTILEKRGYTIEDQIEWPGLAAGNNSIMLIASTKEGALFKVESFADGYIAIFALSDCI